MWWILLGFLTGLVLEFILLTGCVLYIMATQNEKAMMARWEDDIEERKAAALGPYPQPPDSLGSGR
jgi:hypothetical protein